MEFASLINFAYTSERFHYLIEKHVMLPKHRIHEREIFIKGSGSTDAKANTINLTAEIPILRFLRSFGKYVTHLKLDYHSFSMEQMQHITQYIANYCSQSLRKMQLLVMSSFYMRETNQTFPYVTDVQMNFDSWDKFKVHQMFPSMQRLKIDAVYLSILSNERGEASIPKNLKALEITGQLTTMAINNVNKILPNLEELKFWYDPMLIRPVEIVQFRHVKNLTIRMPWNSDTSTQPPFQFERIESLEIDISTLTNIAINIIRQCTSIKTLHLPKVQQINDEMHKVFDIVSQFPHFNEIILNWPGVVSATEYLNQINQAARGLNLITIYIEYDEFRNILIAAIPPQWQLERTWQEDFEDNRYYLSIIRKNE